MTLCPIPDCGQPAGTRCAMSGCPGFKNTRAVSPLPLRGQTGEAAPSGAASPICQIDTHTLVHTDFPA